MTFEYRTFTLSVQKQPQFGQFDLYFYKEKSTSVGVKVRFRQKQKNDPSWYSDEIECKFIKNLTKIKQGKEIIQKWKKMASSCELKINRFQNLTQKPEVSQSGVETPIDILITNELKRLNHQLVKALKKMPIEKKHLEKNEELFFWISEETDLKDVIMVEKSKSKYEGIEEGMVRAQSLYHIGKESKKAVYATVCCESKSEEEVKKQTKLVGIANQENISYPAFIEKIYRGLM